MLHLLSVCSCGYVRATLDLQGADVLHAALHDVLAAGGELHSPALEVLLIVHGDLEQKKRKNIQYYIYTSCFSNFSPLHSWVMVHHGLPSKGPWA